MHVSLTHRIGYFDFTLCRENEGHIKTPTRRKSPPEQYSMARSGSSLSLTSRTGGTLTAVTTFMCDNFFMM